MTDQEGGAVGGVGQMTAPRWGVPDWRDESAYPWPDTPLHEWRWQFLRRRPDYREFWLGRAKDHFEDRKRFAEYMRQTGDPEYPLPQWRCGWVVDGSFFGGNSRALDPSFPNYRSGIGIFESSGGSHSTWRADPEAQREAETNGLLSLEFDLNEPLADQLDRARRLLEIEQAEREGALVKPGRLHRRKWRLYLRVIDARDDGQSWSTITREIVRPDQSSEPQAGRQVWEQARRVMIKIGS